MCACVRVCVCPCTFAWAFPSMQQVQSRVIVKTYTEELSHHSSRILGELQVNVQYGEQAKRLRLIVVADTGPAEAYGKTECRL